MSNSIVKISEAIRNVMSEVKGIDKTMIIGTGQNSYKGVSDQEVKKIIGESMQRNGLAIIPIMIDEETKVSEWDEIDQYAKVAGATKHKTQVFVKVKTTYLLTHSSGEYIQLVGYGHGIDSQDKAAGKATTYALKYALLYMFMVPTGKIDDTDNTHSDEIQPPKPKAQPLPVPPPAPDNLGADPLVLANLIMKIDCAKTTDELMKIYAAHNEWHKEKEFITALAKKKQQLKNVMA